MTKRTSEERERFWRGLIGRQPASGLSISRYCEQAGVSKNSFYVWKQRLRAKAGGLGRSRELPEHSAVPSGKRSRSQKSVPVSASLVPVRLVADPPQRSTSNAGAVEIEWPSGLVLRVPAGCDADAVRDVVKALTPLLVEGVGSC